MRLTVWGNSEQVDLDLIGNESLSVDYQFSNVQDIGVLSSTFSKSFRIPATPTNVAFFGEVYNPNLEGWFDPKRKLQCTISIDSIPVVRGHLQLKNTYIREGNWAEFEVAVFGEQVNFAKDVGEKKLSDLDYSSLDETVNWANVQAKWTGSQDLRYGLCDRGRNWSYNGEGGSTVPNDSNPIYAGEFTPMVSEPWLIEKIFSEAGWEIDSDFVTNDIDNVYTPFYNGESVVSCGSFTPEGEVFNVGVISSTVVANASISSPAVVGNQSDTGNFYDTGSNYTIGAGSFDPHYYTCPYSGIFTFNVWFHGSCSSFPLTPIFFLIKNETQGTIEWLDTHIGSLGVSMYAGGIEVLANSGDQIRIGIAEASSGGVLTLNGTSAVDYQSGTGWELVSITQPLYGETLDLAKNAPDMKQIDFIKACAKKYNLITAPDVNNPKKLKVEPFNDYIGTGSAKDWTHKLDESKDKVLSPVADVQNKTFELTYTSDKDILNKWVEEKGKRVYGRKLVEDSENDFATADKKIVCEFAPTPLNLIGGTTVLIPKFISETGERIEAKPRTLYWVGEEDIETDTIYAYNDATTSAVAMTVYGHFGHFDVKIPDVGDNDLNFSQDTPFQVVNGIPANNLYKTYWETYYNSTYSSDSKMMTAYFALTAVDIHNFKFSDNIYVKDTKWRINRISGFDPTGESPTKVELIKILPTPTDCAYVPTGSNTDGSIIFEDAGGTTSDGNQECCEFYGYEWDAGKSKCFNPSLNQATPVAINPLNISPMNQNAGTNNGQGNLLTGQANQVGASNYNLLSGIGNEVGDGVTGGLIGGHFNEVLDRVHAPIIGGQRAYGFERGLHFGGNVYDNDTTELNGRAQAGVMVLSGKGDIEAENDTIELFIHGEADDNGRFNLRTQTSMNWRCTIQIVEYNETLNRILNSLTQYINFEVEKQAASSVNATGALTEIGSAYTGLLTPSIDTTTNTAQHRLILTAGSGTLPTQPLYVTCRIDYVHTGLGH